MYKATCHTCHKRKDDRKMIYVVGEDEYYCNQKCIDKHNQRKKREEAKEEMVRWRELPVPKTTYR